MTLTIGTGPFGDQGEKTFNFEIEAPRDHVLYFEDSPRRVRVMFNGETVADSRRVKLMHEKGLLPVYYFPEEDVRMDLLEESEHTTHCPFKGDASYWSERVGDIVAETQRPKVLFETGLPPRYYIPPEDVREDVLIKSQKTTRCPYKGIASYWSVEARGERVEDLVWYYPEPIPEAAKIKGLLAFFKEKVDLEVDGEIQERPKTQWS